MTASPATMPLPRLGDIVAGKFVLERLLGQGGMGAVFAARHVTLSKQVAIKIMLAEASNPEARTRFVNEGRAAAQIQNEHVIRVDDVGDEMGYAYMVLELLEGEDLGQLLEKEPTHRLAAPVAVSYVLQALNGVMEAHAIGIVHRDLKPSNLFLSRRKDGSVVVKVLDFGISKAQGSSALAASPSALTSTQAMLGSPLYMSPEQLRSSKTVDHRADIWAVGIILYELITGRLPFNGETLGELFAAILSDDPAPLRQDVELDPRLEEVVLRCLARRPEQRFQTAQELAAALAPFAGAPVTISSVSQPSVRATGPVLPAMPAPHAQTPGAGGLPGGTVPLGAATPTGLRQSTGGWQRTGSEVRPPLPKSKAPLVAAVAGGFFLLALMGVLLVVKAMGRHDTTRSDDPSSSGSVAPVAASNPSPVVTLTTTEPSGAPTSSASASASAALSASALAVTPPATSVASGKVAAPSTHTSKTSAITKPPETKPPEAPKPPETKPPVPDPKPSGKSTPADGLQNTR